MNKTTYKRRNNTARNMKTCSNSYSEKCKFHQYLLCTQNGKNYKLIQTQVLTKISENGNTVFLVRAKTVAAVIRNCCQYLKKLNTGIANDPEILLLNTYFRENSKGSHSHTKSKYHLYQVKTHTKHHTH